MTENPDRRIRERQSDGTILMRDPYTGSYSQEMSAPIKGCQLPTVFLDGSGLVVAVFLYPEDAHCYAAASEFKYLAMPFNVQNLDRTPLPRVGETYRA